MQKNVRDERKPWLALGAALAFLAAAILEAVIALSKHQRTEYLAAAGFGAAALLWLLVYWSWRKRG